MVTCVIPVTHRWFHAVRHHDLSLVSRCLIVSSAMWTVPGGWPRDSSLVLMVLLPLVPVPCPVVAIASLSDMRDEWLIDGEWVAGEEVVFQMRITANHGGVMEYRWACGDGKAAVEMADFYDVDAYAGSEANCFAKHPTANFRGGQCLVPRTLQRVDKGAPPAYMGSRQPARGGLNLASRATNVKDVK